MTLNLSIPKTDSNFTPRITVIGVGGAGGNAVGNMIQANVEGVEFMIANTDAQALGQSLCERRVQIGRTITQGLGAGSRPDIGRAAAEETLDELLAEFEGVNMVFITAGMGGGTGTGAAPVIARAAREAGILTVGVVTKPFQFEGVHRMRMAEAGIADLTQYVDTLIVIPNQNLFRVANEKTTFADAFKMADDVLRSGVRGVTDLMVMPGLINLDFADIRSVMTEMGKAMMGTGEAEGENRALGAAEAAISNPLLDEVSMKGARGVLINITGGLDLTLFEVDEAANRIRDEVDPEANIIFGSTFDQNLEGRMRVSVVATGIDAEAAQAPRPVSLSVVSPQVERAAPAQARAAATPRPATAARADASGAGSPDTEQPPAVAAAGWAPAGRSYGYAQAASRSEPAMTMPAAGATRMASAAATAAVAEADEPVAAVAKDSFIAPPAVEPEPELEARPAWAEPDPFAAAALANGSRAPRLAMDEAGPGFDRKKAQRLFARMTEGAARALQAANPGGDQRDPRRGEPRLTDRGMAPEGQAKSAPEHAPGTRPAPDGPAQPRLSGLDQAAPGGPDHADEDILDIPAFLRRQAN